MSSALASLMREQMMEVMHKPAGQRPESLMDGLVGWMKMKSELFQAVPKETVKDILQNCTPEVCKPSDIIVEQGERGDCFFVLLEGQVDVYVNTSFGEKEEGKVCREPTEIGARKQAGDPAQFGIHVASLFAGHSFGELALINADCVRNATVLALDQCYLLVVSRELYNRCLRQAQEADLREREDFVRNSVYFQKWQVRYKRQLAFSLKRKQFSFEEPIARQGHSINGLVFVVKGQAEVQIDPSTHHQQYPVLMKDVPQEDAAIKEQPMKLRRSRTFVKPRSENEQQELPRSAGPLVACIVGQGEIIGDVEVCMELPSFAESYVCKGSTSGFYLDGRHFERLVAKKNPWTVDQMRVAVEHKLQHRASRIQEWRAVPLYELLLKRAQELNDQKEMMKQRQEAEATGAKFQLPSPAKEDLRTGSAMFRQHRGPLIDQFGPGSVFYRNREREKKKRNETRLRAQLHDAIIHERYLES